MNPFGRFVALYCKDQRGAVAVMFGLSFIMMVMFVGIAVDTSRGVSTEKALSDMLDAAALAGAKILTADGASDEEIKKLVAAKIDADKPRIAKFDYDIGALKVEIDRDAGKVKVSMDGKMPTLIGGVIGINNMNISKESAATLKVQDIELSMMLDVTGSMNANNKIGGLRDAAKELVDLLLTEEVKTYKVRLGVVPFSNSVNAGTLANTVKGKAGINTCVTERKKNDGGFTDESPKKGKPLGDKALSCPSSVVVPLTDDKDVLLNSIGSLTASGATAGHLGTAWAWYMVSPEWSDVVPAQSVPVAYNDDKTIKVVVLMTDGVYNVEYEKTTNGTSTVQAETLCDNIKASGVQVFTVGFEAPTGALVTLKKCATSENQFFDAKDSEELKSAFRQIAEQVTALRLTQ